MQVQQLRISFCKFALNLYTRLHDGFRLYGTAGLLVLIFLRQLAVAAVRYLSFVFACGKACDKIVLLARMVESDPWLEMSCQKESKWPWQLWQNQRATLEPAAIAKSS